MNKELYLKEDEDILNRIREFFPDREDGKLAYGMPEIQIISMLRLRKSFEDSSQTQERFNWVLLVFTIVQILIALFTFTYSLFLPNSELSKIVVFAILMVSIIIFTEFALSERNKV